ncbi:MAG: hypothetical protein KBE91_11965 [Bacteroidia bacterium]|nr:hypothetical protein [Bacteroidia bacterium]MBP9690322.1 hypothetical protein [Bacteroidia bacterium]
MDTKLTLKINDSVIEQAKLYAKNKNTSLSKLIESYLNKLITPVESHEITPLVKSISGVIELPEAKNLKQEYRDYILKKYSK